MRELTILVLMKIILKIFQAIRKKGRECFISRVNRNVERVYLSQQMFLPGLALALGCIGTLTFARRKISNLLKQSRIYFRENKLNCKNV